MILANAYAQGLYSVTCDKDSARQEQYVLRLALLLKRKGHITLLPRILREYKKIEKLRKQYGAQLICARQSDVEHFKREVQEYIQNIDIENMTTHVNDDLIGGFMYKSQETVIDASYKARLLNLYRLIVN